MNLSEALNAALPELPARQARPEAPRLDPEVVGREHSLEGRQVIFVHRPGTSTMFTLTPQQWEILQYFDGERTYSEVCDAIEQETGEAISEDDLRELGDQITQMDLWYRSPQERNIALMQKLAEQRNKHVKKKSKYGDVAHMQFSAWDPDKFLTKVHERFAWLYSGWFTSLTLALFAFMIYIFIVHWDQIGADTLKYYTFTEKSAADLAEFWILFLIVGFFHESAHGLTCKHFGGGVHKMGFHLIYLTPAFFVDVTECWIYANRWQRLATIIAGIWSELIFCAIATLVWWGTAPGSFAHEFSYKIILLTGVAVVLINLNPLIKLDGYYFFSELLDIEEIKERSTAYFSGLVRRHIFRMPVEIDFVPKRLRALFIAYAVLSGLYSYGLLLFAAKICNNIMKNLLGEAALLPTLFITYLIFRSRINTFFRFMQILYLDKREMLLRWSRNPMVTVPAGAALIVLLFFPIWRENVESPFVLEAGSRAVVRAHVPGRMMRASAFEGQRVLAGDVLAELENLSLRSQAAQQEAEFRRASLTTQSARIDFGSFGVAQQQRQAAEVQRASAVEQVRQLQLRSPIEGVVLTPRVADKVGSWIEAGDEIAEVANTDVLRARLYVADYAMRKMAPGKEVRLYVPGYWLPFKSVVEHVATASTPLPEGLIHKEDFKGMGSNEYYAVQVALDNRELGLRPGMVGAAKVTTERRSAVGMGLQQVWDFLGRKVW